MKKILILIVLLSYLTICGCGRDDNPVDTSTPVIETPEEDLVMANCLAVQSAAEVFAAENSGIYPRDVASDTSSCGHTLLDLLPEGHRLENPYTKSQTEPVDGAASKPGETGYEPFIQNNFTVGYNITGYGEDTVIVKLTNIGSPEEAKVRANCLIVQMAAEEGAAQCNGAYPSDDINDRWSFGINPYYNYIGRYLPDRRPLVNPFTGLLTEPVSHTAVDPGETGYTAVRQDGANVGYVITGYGQDSLIVVLTNLDYTREEALVASNCRTVQLAAEAFALQNGILYPENINIDHNAAGYTLLDLLPGGQLLENPYTRLRTEPVDYPTGRPGGIHYDMIQMYGWDICYVVTGNGMYGPIAELTNIESPEQAVLRANCLTLQQAVEEFASLNNGEYPEDVDTDTTPGGERVIDLLPRGHLLENPYTHERTQPVNYTATFPGETGYAMVCPYEYPECHNIGYVISGYGANSMQVVVTNLDYQPREAIVISNCRTVQLAVEAFAAQNGGVYPGNTDVDVTPAGETVLDFLPYGVRLVNPFTLCASEPVNASAHNPGEVGYVTLVQGGVNAGYTITGSGRSGTVIIHLVWPEGI